MTPTFERSLIDANVATAPSFVEAANADAVALGNEAVPLLETRDLRISFGLRGRSVLAVDGLSYRLFPGKTLAIIGESGSGKTVSCRAVMGLLPSTATVTGSIRLGGRELLGLREAEMRGHRGADIAMVFQDAARSLNPTMRVGQQVSEAIRAHERMSRAAAQRRAVELLHELRVPAANQRYFAYPHQLSGGMQQRVLIAMALACNPRVLIADEATKSVDVTTQARIMEFLLELRERFGMALLMISHDLRLAADFADDVLVMYAGRPVEHAPADRLFADARMPYTKAMLDAAPSLDKRPHTPFAVPERQSAEPSAASLGCAFEPRCSRAQARCTQTSPPFLEHEPGHSWACWCPHRLADSDRT
jgi:oligopeptide/dipeptide ABC transporter ATP-binding protein